MVHFKQLRCSFCRRKDSEVQKLVAGPRAYSGARVYICDACVAIATQIMIDTPGDGNQQAVRVSLWRRLSNFIRSLLAGYTQRGALPITSQS